MPKERRRLGGGVCYEKNVLLLIDRVVREDPLGRKRVSWHLAEERASAVGRVKQPERTEEEAPSVAVRGQEGAAGAGWPYSQQVGKVVPELAGHPTQA